MISDKLFIKKIGNTNIYFKTFIIKINLVKNSIKEKNLLIVWTNFELKIKMISIALYYIKNKIKIDSITNQIKSENTKNWKLGLKI